MPCRSLRQLGARSSTVFKDAFEEMKEVSDEVGGAVKSRIGLDTDPEPEGEGLGNPVTPEPAPGGDADAGTRTPPPDDPFAPQN